MADRTLEKWQEIIESNFRKEELSTTRSMNIVNSLGQSKEIKRVVHDILNNDKHLRKVASRSYRHSNGFDKFVLIISTDPPYKLRLHIWWENEDIVSSEHIHNHSWDFSSALVTGAFRFQTYEPGRNGLHLYKYECKFPKPIEKGQEIKDSDAGYKMCYLGKSELVNIFDTIFSKGDSYSLSQNVLHRITNIPKTLTSTVVLHGKFLRNSSDLFAQELLDGSKTTAVSQFTVAELVARLEKYLCFL